MANNGMTHWSEFDVSKVQFSDKIMEGKNSVKYVFLNYGAMGSRQKLRIVTPKLRVPLGIKHFELSADKPESFLMDIAYDIDEERSSDRVQTQQVKTYYEKIVGVNDLIKKTLYSHKADWLNKPKMTENMLDDSDFFHPLVREAVNDKTGERYSDRTRIKLIPDERGTNKFVRTKTENQKAPYTLAFNEDFQEIPLNRDNCESVVPRNSMVNLALEIPYITISKMGISVAVRIVQLQVFQKKDDINANCVFSMDSIDVSDLDDQNDSNDNKSNNEVNGDNNEVNEDELKDELEPESDVSDEDTLLTLAVNTEKPKAKRVYNKKK